jgi:hypothetical protein
MKFISTLATACKDTVKFILILVACKLKLNWISIYCEEIISETIDVTQRVKRKWLVMKGNIPWISYLLIKYQLQKYIFDFYLVSASLRWSLKSYYFFWINLLMWDFRFPRRQVWRWQSSGMTNVQKVSSDRAYRPRRWRERGAPARWCLMSREGYIWHIISSHYLLISSSFCLEMSMTIENPASCEIRSVIKILMPKMFARLKFIGNFMKFMEKILWVTEWWQNV